MLAHLAFFYISPEIFWTLFIFVFGFSIYAQIRVTSAYSRNSQIPSRGGITGREAAAAVMGMAPAEIAEVSDSREGIVIVPKNGVVADGKVI